MKRGGERSPRRSQSGGLQYERQMLAMRFTEENTTPPLLESLPIYLGFSLHLPNSHRILFILC